MYCNNDFVPCGLLCEYGRRPSGIDCQNPRFFWQASHLRRGAMQGAFRILVASSKQLLLEETVDFWDSGKVVSEECHTIYGGKTLLPGCRYYWCVKLWDELDNESVFSEIEYFDTGILCADNWVARWLSAPFDSSHVAPMFRKEFALDKEVKDATVYLCGLGYYEFYLNGQKVGREVLHPGFTDYSQRVLYTTYRVGELLQLGKNVLGIMLGNGWFGNGHPFLRDLTASWLSEPKFLFQLEIHYADGSSETVISDEHSDWKTAPSPILENNIYDGETYDARLEKEGWILPEYQEDADWQDAVMAQAPTGTLVSQNMEDIEIMGELQPISIHNPAEGVFVCDFGQNVAGWVRIRLKGQRGHEVKLKFAEVLYDNGFINQENLMKAAATDRYILKGSQNVEVYEPRFTYHGFRYVQIEGFHGVLSASDITARLVRNAVDIRGRFQCSNALINRIQQNVMWTELDNIHSIPTDCPQRSERMGWLNDATARVEEMIYNLHVPRLLAKWENDIQDTTNPENGAIKDTAPAVFSKRIDGDPVDSCYILIPWFLYRHYGDVRILEEHYAGMKAWVQYLGSRSKDYVIEAREYDLGDWASPEKWLISPNNPRSEITPSELISTGYYYYDAKLMAEVADVLHYEEDKRQFQTLSEHIKEAFHKRFYDEQTKQYGGGSQGSNAFALFLGIVPRSERAEVVRNMVEDIKKQDYHLTTGNLCTKYIMEVLCEEGYEDVAYQLATQTTYPSWGYMIEQGATTVWERWEHSSGGGMNSHNHPMYASISSWFYKYLAGIRVESGAPGFREFTVRPYMPQGLHYVDACVSTVLGVVSVFWKKYENKFVLQVGVPFGSTASVWLPGDHVPIKVGSGTYNFICENEVEKKL